MTSVLPPAPPPQQGQPTVTVADVDTRRTFEPLNGLDEGRVEAGKREREREEEREGERERGRERQRERERERERWNSISKTLFYKDCSLGSVKNLSNNYSLLSY